MTWGFSVTLILLLSKPSWDSSGRFTETALRATESLSSCKITPRTTADNLALNVVDAHFRCINAASVLVIGHAGGCPPAPPWLLVVILDEHSLAAAQPYPDKGGGLTGP